MYTTTTFIGDNDHYPLGTVKRAAVPKEFAHKKQEEAATFAVIKPKEEKPKEKLDKIAEVDASAIPVQEVEAEQAVPVAEKKVRKTRAKKTPKVSESEKGEQADTTK